MKNRHRVVWTKGMFLTPQHFQIQDQFFENNIQYRFASSHYANWGVTDLNIDSEALENGQFRLSQCSGIMPDGESFEPSQARVHLRSLRGSASAPCCSSSL